MAARPLRLADVMAEPCIYLMWPRAALLQLAHPGIAPTEIQSGPDSVMWPKRSRHRHTLRRQTRFTAGVTETERLYATRRPATETKEV